MKQYINAILIGLVLMIPSASTNASWCGLKATLAVEIYEERDLGTTTEEEELAALVKKWSDARRAGDAVVDWYMIVDVQRMIRDIFRDNNGEYTLYYEDVNDFHDLEMYVCMTGGF